MTSLQVATIVSAQVFAACAFAQPAQTIALPAPNNDPSKGHVWRAVEVIVPTAENAKYESIGVIPSIETGLSALGTLLTGCLIVAPRHAVLRKFDPVVDVVGRTAVFQYGYTGDVGKPYCKNQVEIEAIFCGTVNSDGSYSVADDWCVFRSKRTLTGEIPKMTIAKVDLEMAKMGVNAAVGFTAQSVAQAGGQLALGKDTHAWIQGGIESVYAMNAVATSGSPLVIDRDGRQSMVAIVVTYQFAVPMTTVVRAIESTPLEKRQCSK